MRPFVFSTLIHIIKRRVAGFTTISCSADPAKTGVGSTITAHRLQLAAKKFTTSPHLHIEILNTFRPLITMQPLTVLFTGNKYRCTQINFQPRNA
jgi:hypothetical protein